MFWFVREAFHRSFLRSEIQSAFRRAGLWPVDHTKLLAVPRKLNSNSESPVLSVSELESLFVEKIKNARQMVLGQELEVAKCGYIDTARGAVLTSDEALRAAKTHSERVAAKRVAEVNRENERILAREARRTRIQAREEELLQREKIWIRKAEVARWVERARLAKMDVFSFRQSVRPLNARRRAARERVEQKKRVNDAQLLLSVCMV